jgi:hypothetical protein
MLAIISLAASTATLILAAYIHTRMDKAIEELSAKVASKMGVEPTQENQVSESIEEEII